jgi:MFS family permease
MDPARDGPAAAEANGGPARGGGFLRALAHRNFRLYFAGQGVSLVGTWMQQMALSWVVYQLAEHRPELGQPEFWLGVVTFAGQIPAFFLAPFAGVLVDRVIRHRLLVVTQGLMMVQAFALWWLDVSGQIAVWQIIALSLMLGLVNAFDMPGRQAFLTDMIERREDLGNAIALNSSIFNGARIVGPMLAGFLLAVTSADFCFLVNALSYVAVLIALLAMRVRPHVRPRSHPPVLHGLAEGFRYAFGFQPIRAILLLLALVSLMGTSYTVLLPIFADRVLHGGAAAFSYLTAAAGVGALAAAVYLAGRPTVLGLGKWIAACPCGFGLALIVFSFSHDLWLSLPAMFVTGGAMMLHMAASNTILQTIVEEDKRGRVMSFYTMAFMGMSPLGSLLAGWLGGRIGVENMVGVAGVSCVAGGVLFATALPALRARVRPIYRRMGILPEVASGLESATELHVPPQRA